jgi:hypothetical protein
MVVIFRVKTSADLVLSDVFYNFLYAIGNGLNIGSPGRNEIYRKREKSHKLLYFIKNNSLY